MQTTYQTDNMYNTNNPATYWQKYSKAVVSRKDRFHWTDLSFLKAENESRQ